VKIDPDRVTYETKAGQLQSRRADTIIMALGAESDSSTAHELRTACAIVHVIGDAAELTYIDGAMRTGNQVGRKI
jgi:2,4-dienoyl-CoA reductase (NADPH2)